MRSIRFLTIAVRVVFSVFLITILTSANVAASAFTIQSVQNEIVGQIESEGTNIFFYDIQSTTPISYGVTDTAITLGILPYMASSEADGTYLAVSAQGKCYCNAAAISTIDFTPTFDGEGPDVTFFSVRPTEGWGVVPGFGPVQVLGWTIKDLTTDTLISNEIPGGPITGQTQLLYGTEFNGDLSTDYAWDSTHTYQLQMVADVSTNAGGLYGGWLSTNMFDVNVPEPSTIQLLSAALVLFACLGAWSRRSNLVQGSWRFAGAVTATVHS